MSDLAIGLDIGTTTIKSALFALDDPSEPVAVARRSSAICSPQAGWSETDPVATEQLALATLRDVVGQAQGGRIAAIGISGTACGAWLIDETGSLVRRPILWNDGRAADVLDRWRSADLLSRIFEISGNMPFPGYTLPVLAWLSEHEPLSLERADACLCCKDWMRLRLTGVVATDEGDASYVPFDIRARAWSDRLLELTGLAGLRRLFPRLAAPRETATLLPDLAHGMGIPAGTPVAVGATDIIAGVVGAGAIAPGRAVTLFGTSANSTLITDAPVFLPVDTGIMAASPLGRWARSMLNTSGSATLDWAANLLTGGDIGRLIELAESAPAGADGVTLAPYLSPAGVVSPVVDPHATGTIAGLRLQHGPAHLARAAVEGLALAVADGYAAMPVPVDEIHAVGGAARSDLLLRSLADASGLPVVRLEGDEFGARGVALLAAWAAGAIDDLETTVRQVATARRFEPDPASVLAGRLDRYRAIARTGLSLQGLG